jgi:hypothetical protein
VFTSICSTVTGSNILGLQSTTKTTCSGKSRYFCA